MSFINILFIEENNVIVSEFQEHLSAIKGLAFTLANIKQLSEMNGYLERNSVSLILLDLSNADSDGLEKIRNTRLLAPLLPIIVLINSDTNDFHQLVTSVGADDFLYKHTLHPELTLRTLRYTIEQKRNIAKRSKIENKFEDLVNLLPQPVFECDLKGNLVFANDLAFKIFGYSKKEFLMCLNVSQMIAEKDRARAAQNIELVLRGKLISDHEYTMLRKDGTSFPARVSSNPILNNGTAVGLRGIIIDLTESKLTEESIRVSEEKFNHAFNLSPIAMSIQDADDFFIDVNDAFLRLTEYNREEILGFQGKDLNLWADPDERKLAEDQYNAEGGVKNFEFKFRKKSGLIGVGIIWAEKITIDGKPAVLTTALDITARRDAEEAVRQNWEKYKNIFNSAPVGIYQSTRDGKILSANDRLAQILGYGSKYELMQLDMGKDIYFEETEREKHISEYGPIGNVADLELCWKKKDGTPVWIQLTAQVITDHTGKMQYYEGFVRNINEQKEAETELRENQKLLSTVIETMPLGIWLIDKKGTVIHGNSAAQNIWGGSKYVGPDYYDSYKGWFVGTGEKIRPEQWGAARAIQKGESTLNEEIEIESFDGKRKTILHSAVPIRNSQKEITGAIALNQEITELRLKDSQIRKLSRAVDQSPVLIIITNTSGEIEYVNPKFEQVTGYSLAETVGRNPRFLKSGYTSRETYEELWKTIKAGNEWRGEFHNVAKNGNRYWESAVISPIKNSSGVITNYLAVKEDISEQKRITAELIKAKERAENLDNLKTEFLAQMSHEIRTPLNILLSFSTYIKEILEERDHLTEDLDHYFTVTKEAGKRIIRTIELILNMSDLNSGSFINNPKPTDIVNEILKPVFHQLHQSFEEGNVFFDLVAKSDSLFSNIDPFAVEQMLIHVIENALKFTSKGHVLIVAEKSSSGNAVIGIEDTGVGIGEEYIKRLYTPFTQEDQGHSRSYDGNGLGLALVKKYCELNGIIIDVKSQKRAGTKFTFTFPK